MALSPEDKARLDAGKANGKLEEAALKNNGPVVTTRDPKTGELKSRPVEA